MTGLQYVCVDAASDHFSVWRIYHTHVIALWSLLRMYAYMKLQHILVKECLIAHITH